MHAQLDATTLFASSPAVIATGLHLPGGGEKQTQQLVTERPVHAQINAKTLYLLHPIIDLKS